MYFQVLNVLIYCTSHLVVSHLLPTYGVGKTKPLDCPLLYAGLCNDLAWLGPWLLSYLILFSFSHPLVY